MWWKPQVINMDYAAATPVRDEVLKAMSPYWSEVSGNPSSIHAAGVKAKTALDAAREKVARTLRVRANDVVFTSGGTESNNLAILGYVRSMKDAGVSMSDIEIISTKAEHPSVSRTLEVLESEGIKVIRISLGEDGRVVAEEFKKALSPKTRLITVAYVNSETGIIEDIGKLSRLTRAYEKENGLTILFHTDASQAPLWLPCALDALGVDMLTLDAGKCAGPKGVGILARRPRARVSSIANGGSQENSLRPGTEPLPLIVGAAEALFLAQKEYEKVSTRVAKVRNYLIQELQTIPEVTLNGSKENRVANNVNISIPGIDTEFAVIALSAAGVYASTKSACSGAGSGVSQPVFTMTGDYARAASTIRFTLSPQVTKRDVDAAVQALKEHLENSKL